MVVVVVVVVEEEEEEEALAGRGGVEGKRGAGTAAVMSDTLMPHFDMRSSARLAVAAELMRDLNKFPPLTI